MATMASNWNNVIGHHVTQGAGVFVETATGFHADGFGGGDLHVVDVMVVPERFEQAVGKAADENVLHCISAQVMIDAVDLLLLMTLSKQAFRASAVCRSEPNGFSSPPF